MQWLLNNEEKSNVNDKSLKALRKSHENVIRLLEVATKPFLISSPPSAMISFGVASYEAAFQESLLFSFEENYARSEILSEEREELVTERYQCSKLAVLFIIRSA